MKGTSRELIALPNLTSGFNDQVFPRGHLAKSEVAGAAAGRLMPLALDLSTAYNRPRWSLAVTGKVVDAGGKLTPAVSPQ